MYPGTEPFSAEKREISTHIRQRSRFLRFPRSFPRRFELQRRSAADVSRMFQQGQGRIPNPENCTVTALQIAAVAGTSKPSLSV